MAIPGSSDGQEVLRRGVILAQSSSGGITAFNFAGASPTTGSAGTTVPSNHVITMLSIIWCETQDNAELIYLQHVQGYILFKQAIAGYGTFIWNERLSLKGGEFLKTWFDSSADVDVIYSYLDQDWS